MRRNPVIVIALSTLMVLGAGRVVSAGIDPGPRITGNDTGGIIPYTPDLQVSDYRQMAAAYCAGWGRLSHVTSVHRKYGDYVSFVCIDKPWMIH